jgi:hypothetical protein
MRDGAQPDVSTYLFLLVLEFYFSQLSISLYTFHLVLFSIIITMRFLNTFITSGAFLINSVTALPKCDRGDICGVGGLYTHGVLPPPGHGIDKRQHDCPISPLRNGDFSAPRKPFQFWTTTRENPILPATYPVSPTYENKTESHSAAFLIQSSSVTGGAPSISQSPLEICVGAKYELTYWLAYGPDAVAADCYIAVGVGGQVVVATQLEGENLRGSMNTVSFVHTLPEGALGGQAPFSNVAIGISCQNPVAAKAGEAVFLDNLGLKMVE